MSLLVHLGAQAIPKTLKRRPVLRGGSSSTFNEVAQLRRLTAATEFDVGQIIDYGPNVLRIRAQGLLLEPVSANQLLYTNNLLSSINYYMVAAITAMASLQWHRVRY